MEPQFGPGNVASSGSLERAPPAAGLASCPVTGTSFFLLGFLTLAVQVVLLRELFSVLYGSDLAFGFALAAWTVLTALGAMLTARSRRAPRGVGRWGLCAYAGVGIAVFLAVRAWGAAAVIPFQSYLLMPLFLAPLCLLGGMLFPWFLAEGRGLPTARAYAWEVAGGLVAGLACAAAFHGGALACPFLLGLALLAATWGAVAARRRGRGLALGLAGLVVAVLPLTPAGQALERLSLRLRLRQGQVEAAMNTPFASLLAVRDEGGQITVYENGMPWPLPEYTAGRAAVAAVLQALPAATDRAVFVQALRAGFAPVLGAAPFTVPPHFLETDPLAVAFARQHLGGMDAGRRPEPFGRRTLQAEDSGWDLVAVLSPGPGGLLANRPLTREFATLVRAQLSPRGVFAIALPAAPGFTHPAQEAYIETVAQALREVFPAFCELRTQVGWTLLVAGRTALDRQAAAGRLIEHASGSPPEVVAEALNILNQAGAVSLDALAGEPTGTAADGLGAPANRISAPLAYFRFLQFRSRLVDDAPAWWRWLFRERSGGASLALLVAILVAGMLGRRGRSLQGVVWAAWGATLALVLAIYLYQSVTGEAFWTVALLSAASMAGILGGTRLRRGPAADWASAGVAWVPAALFPLYPLLERLPGWVVLALLLVLVATAGSCLGYAFARRSALRDGVAAGVALFAVDLLGAGAGLFLGGVLLPWWSGFELPALAGGVITCAVLAAEACRRDGA